MINSDKRRVVAARMREIMRQYPDCLLDGMIARDSDRGGRANRQDRR